jgi:chitinase
MYELHVRHTLNLHRNDWASRKNTVFSVGLPTGTRAAGSGYIEPDDLSDVLREAKSLGRMGGAMLWDASQAWSNGNYHKAVKKALVEGTAVAFRC